MSLLLALAALAQTPVEPAVPSAAPAAEAKKICRRVATTGSRFAKRECRTAAEWQVIDSQTGGSGYGGLSGAGTPR